MKHFYFKFQASNVGFKNWIKGKNHEEIRVGDAIELSIYYGEWKTDDFRTNNIGKQSKIRLFQILTFFEIEMMKDDVFFWIFDTDKIFCFRAIDKKIYDGVEPYSEKEKKNYSKSIKAELFKSFSKIELPEFFANINSNQYYNRGTIREFKSSVKEFADSLIVNKPIKINSDNFLEFVSPIQFETLLFLIFNTENSICSSFRGGTLKDYDLKINVINDFHGIPIGKHWIQVKLKNRFPKNKSIDYMAYKGKTDLGTKLIGSEWIIDRIKDRKDILNWMHKSLYDFELFDPDLSY